MAPGKGSHKLSAPATRTGTCALCLQTADLVHSHIIPEFCYKPAYDAKHRAWEMRSSSPTDRTIQKGKREYLLCGRCDSERVGGYEKYFKEFWFDGQPLPAVIAGNVVAVSGVDYARFKLFHLSVLWRASVARQAAFSNISLGKYHEEKLRTMILGEDPGPEDAYPVWGRVIVGDDRSVVYDFLSVSPGWRLDTYTEYSMCYAGCEWGFLVTDRAPHAYQARFLKRNAPLQLAVLPLSRCVSARAVSHDRA